MARILALFAVALAPDPKSLLGTIDVPSLQGIGKFRSAILETFWNHYRRAAPDVNIFKFFNYIVQSPYVSPTVLMNKIF
jgi:hypothetical protein